MYIARQNTPTFMARQKADQQAHMDFKFVSVMVIAMSLSLLPGVLVVGLSSIILTKLLLQ